MTSFAVIGDFGNVAEKKDNIDTEKSPANYVGEAVRQMAPDFIVSLGDDNYVEGKREWKDFNTGKNYAPFIYPYTVLDVNLDNPDALAIGSPDYLADRVERKPWNRFFSAPGNHEVGMTGGKGLMEASGRRDWSHDAYYKAAYQGAERYGSLIPIANSYVKDGDILYHDYSYGTSWMPGTYFKHKEGAMDTSYYDYILNPIDSKGKVLSDLANIYMVDRNNAAYGDSNTAFAKWRQQNPDKALDPQADFLMEEAKRRDDDVPWQIFASHYQTYSSSSTQAGMQLPFFANGIDLVMGAHVHNYERIRAADTAGIEGDYIVNGTGGYNTAYKAVAEFGADEFFSPIGTVPGYQAGSTGQWGFGWIDMNQQELRYRQFVVEFTRIENTDPVGIIDKYYGQEPITDVTISLIDTLTLAKSSFDEAPRPDNETEALITALESDQIKRIDYKETDWSTLDWNELFASELSREFDWGLVNWRQVPYSQHNEINWSQVSWGELQPTDFEAIGWSYVDPTQLDVHDRKLINPQGIVLGTDLDDRLISHQRAKIYTGFSGADMFIFDRSTDSGGGTRERDIVTDFSGLEGDRIDLSELRVGTPLKYVGAESFTAAGQVRFRDGVVRVSLDSDDRAEFALRLLSVTEAAFSGDYLLL